MIPCPQKDQPVVFPIHRTKGNQSIGRGDVKSMTKVIQAVMTTNETVDALEPSRLVNHSLILDKTLKMSTIDFGRTTVRVEKGQQAWTFTHKDSPVFTGFSVIVCVDDVSCRVLARSNIPQMVTRQDSTKHGRGYMLIEGLL